MKESYLSAFAFIISVCAISIGLMYPLSVNEREYAYSQMPGEAIKDVVRIQKKLPQGSVPLKVRIQTQYLLFGMKKHKVLALTYKGGE